MRRFLKDRSGGLTIVTYGLIVVLLLSFALITEMGAVIENHEYAESVLQRSCNIAVEENIMDEFRQDRILKLDVAEAKKSFRKYAYKDMPARFSLTIDRIDCTEMPPSMTASGTLTFSTVFDYYDFDDITYTYTVVATNYDIE